MAPVGLSALRVSVTFAQSIDGAASSTLRFALVSISKLLPARLDLGVASEGGHLYGNDQRQYGTDR